jgi:hypothetical protein
MRTNAYPTVERGIRSRFEPVANLTGPVLNAMNIHMKIGPALKLAYCSIRELRHHGTLHVARRTHLRNPRAARPHRSATHV